MITSFQLRASTRTIFGLNRDRLGFMKKTAIVMHPGPMNRGLEITAECADSARSVVCGTSNQWRKCSNGGSLSSLSGITYFAGSCNLMVHTYSLVEI